MWVECPYESMITCNHKLMKCDTCAICNKSYDSSRTGIEEYKESHKKKSIKERILGFFK